jgi:hypothetical protein
MMDNRFKGFLFVMILVMSTLFVVQGMFDLEMDSSLAGQAIGDRFAKGGHEDVEASGLEEIFLSPNCLEDEIAAANDPSCTNMEKDRPDECDEETSIFVDETCYLIADIDYSSFNSDEDKCLKYAGIYFMSVRSCLNPSGDDDEDGYSNKDELNLGSNPLDEYSPVEDGDDLSQNGKTYVLMNDIFGSEDVGLLISGDSITLDCNSYAIKYYGTSSYPTGILITGDDAIVKNCVVESYGLSGMENQGDGTELIDNTLTDNGVNGIYLSGYDIDALVEGNLISNSKTGIKQQGVTRSIIQYNTIKDVSTGISLLHNVGDSNIEENDFSNFGLGIGLTRDSSIDIIGNNFNQDASNSAGTAISIARVSSGITIEENDFCMVDTSVKCGSDVSYVTGDNNYFGGANECSVFDSSEGNSECS